MRDYFRGLWETFGVLSTFAMLPIIAFVIVAVGIGLLFPADQSPRPALMDVYRETHIRELESENLSLRGANVTLEAKCRTLTVDLDALRRSAQWTPPKPAEMEPGDLIPAQHLEIPTRRTP